MMVPWPNSYVVVLVGGMKCRRFGISDVDHFGRIKFCYHTHACTWNIRGEYLHKGERCCSGLHSMVLVVLVIAHVLITWRCKFSADLKLKFLVASKCSALITRADHWKLISNANVSGFVGSLDMSWAQP